MEAQAKQAKWVVPILIATMTALTLIALVTWVQVVLGGVMPGTAPFGGMMRGGMMMNTANTGPAGATPDNCAKMQSDPKMKAIHDNCVKTKGSSSGNMQQHMNNAPMNKTL